MVLVVLWIVLCASFLFLQIARPIFSWQAVDWVTAKRIVTKGFASVEYYQQQPLYSGAIAGCFKVFGIHEVSARLVGVFVYFLIFLLVYMIGSKISSGENKGPVSLIAVILFSISTLSVQGALVTDRADTTTLLFFIVLFYLLLVAFDKNLSTRNLLIVSLVYSFCFLSKMTTPLACFIALFLAFALKGQIKKGIKYSAFVFVVGIGLFLAFWFSFCFYTIGLDRFHEPFSYYGPQSAKAFSFFSPEKLQRVLIDIFSLVMWFSPAFVVLAILVYFTNVKKCFASPKDFTLGEMHIMTFLFVLFGGYLSTTALFSSYPKYVVCGLPLFCCLIAKFVWSNCAEFFEPKNIKYTVVWLMVGVGYYLLFVGDWVYSIYDLRAGSIQGQLSEAFRKIILQQIGYVLFPVIVAILSIKIVRTNLSRRIIYAVFICFLASHLAINIIQTTTDYSTNFAYGTRGVRAFKEFLARNPKLEVHTARAGFVANVNDDRFFMITEKYWNNKEVFLDFIRRKSPECIVYGLAINTAAQMKGLLTTESFAACWKPYYVKKVFGDFQVLVRKDVLREEPNH